MNVADVQRLIKEHFGSPLTGAELSEGQAGMSDFFMAPEGERAAVLAGPEEADDPPPLSETELQKAVADIAGGGVPASPGAPVTGGVGGDVLAYFGKGVR